MNRKFLSLCLFALPVLAQPALKNESFDKDPGWDASNNIIEHKRTTTQDFGYSDTNFASKDKGEVGGHVTRSGRPASYALKIPPLTLDQKFSASGTVAFTNTTAGSGFFFGFFNSDQPGGSGRPVGSLGLDFDGEKAGARLAVRLITHNNQSCGTFITPFIPGKFRPTPIRNDKTRYHFSLAYDPDAANGNGQITFTFHGDEPKPGALITPDMPESYKHEAQIRFPDTTSFTVDLTPGFKKQHTVFDRFGIQNAMKAGGTSTVYFGDLTVNGTPVDLSHDPDWISNGSRGSFADEAAGSHHFGYSEKTNFAGGAAPGEIGGTLWRSGKYAYYADRVGPLDMNQPLEASGKVVLIVGAPDSDMFFGFFNAAEKESPAEKGNFVGVHVGGPTRIGHAFSPVCTTSDGNQRRVKSAPVLAPGHPYDFTIRYDPAANHNNGQIKVTLADKSAALDLQPGDKTRGAKLDRFGLFTSNIGGQAVKIYFDDLKYTVK